MSPESTDRPSLPYRLQLLWLLFAAGVLVPIVWVGLLLANLPYYGLDSFDDAIHSPAGGQVAHVAPAGPAAMSGIKNGDFVVAQNQETLAYSPPSPFLTPEQSVLPLSLLVTHPNGVGSETVMLTPISAPFSVLVARLEALAIALVFWAVSLALVLLRPSYPASRLFFILGQLVAAMLASGSTGAAYYPGGSLVFRVLLILVAAVALHFCATFPSSLQGRRLTATLVTVYASGGLIMVLTVLLPALSINVSSPAMLTIAYRLYVLVVLLSALGLLLSRQHKTSYLALYKQRLLITGMIVSFLPVLSLSFLPELVTGSPLVDYVWTFPTLILLPVAYAYAVRQQTLGRVDLLVSRSLIYAMLTTLLVAGYFALALLVGWVVPTAAWSLPITSVCLTIVSVVLYGRIRINLQRWLDRIFFGGWYDYHSVTRAASATLSQASTLQQLLARLTSITQSMRFQTAELYLPEGGSFVPKSQSERLQSVIDGIEDPAPALPASGQLARYLLAQNRPLRRIDLRLELAKSGEILTESEQALLNSKDLEYLLPLVSRRELRGTLALGMRQADMMLSQEDIEIMMLLASQAAVAAENVGLVEALQARLAEMERMRNDLGEAQRRLAENEEVGRIRLAQELHDGAVQQLLGISYQLVRAQSQAENVPFAVSTNGHSNGNGNGRKNGKAALRKGTKADAVEEFDTTGYVLNGVSEPPEIDLDSIRHEMLSVVTQLRGLIGELRPPGLDEFGVVTAIEGYVSRLRREAQKSGRPMPAVYMDMPGENLDLSRPIALCIFRTTQEALRNCLKHSNASSITVDLQLKSGEVVLSICDDGDGFDVPVSFSKLTQNDHYGLVGIAERIEWLNGTLTIESTPDEGTELTVRIPLPH